MPAAVSCTSSLPVAVENTLQMFEDSIVLQTCRISQLPVPGQNVKKGKPRAAAESAHSADDEAAIRTDASS
jgi:hypothetical protein